MDEIQKSAFALINTLMVEIQQLHQNKNDGEELYQRLEQLKMAIEILSATSNGIKL